MRLDVFYDPLTPSPLASSAPVPINLLHESDCMSDRLGLRPIKLIIHNLIEEIALVDGTIPDNRVIPM